MRVRKSLVLTAALAALVTASAGSVLGWLHGAILGLIPLTVAAISVLDVDNSPDIPDSRQDLAAGARQDLSNLAWDLSSKDGKATPRVLKRLAKLAANKLGLHGITVPPTHPLPSTAAVREILGPIATKYLVESPSTYAPTQKEVRAVVVAIKEIPSARPLQTKLLKAER